MRLLLIRALFAAAAISLCAVGVVFAHPGGRDAKGCHRCRKACKMWKLDDGEYHCHQPDGSVTRPEKAAKAAPEAKKRKTPKAKSSSDKGPRATPKKRRAAAPVVPPGKSLLRVATVPLTEVYVDGERIGATPVEAFELAPGKHTIRLRSERFGVDESYEKQSEAGQLLELNMALK